MSYNEGKIYKITSKQTNMIYIGSTKETLEIRFRKHKCVYTEYLKSNKSGCSSIELLKYQDCEIELIELYQCDSRLELCRREGEIQLENISIIVNKYIAGRTQEEWYVDNKEHYAEYYAQRYLDNKEHYAEYKAQYYLNNKEKIAQYRLDNRDRISAPIQCKCGSNVRFSNKARHLKSKMHISFVSA